MFKYRFYKTLRFFHLISKKKFKEKTAKYTQEYRLLAKSKLFDKKWYLATYPDVKEAKADPVQHYLVHGWREGRKPSKNFDISAFQLKYGVYEINPLFYYEKNRLCKKKEAIKMSNKLVFPQNSINISYKSPESNREIKRLAIFASFSQDAKIHDYVIYYLKELKKVVDGIIFEADNPLLPTELDKIKDLVLIAECNRHEEYDFGSYKRGYLIAKKEKYLNTVDEIVLCNDSVFGPIYALDKVFNMVKFKDWDFWGMIKGTDTSVHLQSWFLCFKANVIYSHKLEEFLLKVKKETSFMDVVTKYEFKLTEYLKNYGFKYGAFISDICSENQASCITNGNSNQTLFPIVLIKKYGFPFVKIKFFTDNSQNFLKDSAIETLSVIQKCNHTLYNIILKELVHRNENFREDLEKCDIKRIMKKSKVISFDCFDTLLIRPYVVPTDLFLHMEKYYDAPGFAQARINAEKRASMLKKHVTLTDIYEAILPKYQNYLDKELLFEKTLLKSHPINMKLYQQAVKLKKKIIVISDMYLPEQFIREALNRNGYTKIDRVFVSCECKCSKGSGKLYNYVLNQLQIKSQELLHIGDNYVSDIKSAENIGIKTYFVKKYMDRFGLFYGNLKYINFFQHNLSLEGSILVSQNARHNLISKLPYWQEIGYSFAGPLILGYIQKITKEVQENGIDTLLFVSRDGYLLQKIYNIYVKNPIENHYVYAPRVIYLKCFGSCENPLYFKKFLQIITKEIPELSKYAQMKEIPPQILAEYSKQVYLYLSKNKKRYKKYLETLRIKGKRIASVDMTTGAFSSELLLSKFLTEKYCLGIFSGTFKENIGLKYITYKKSLIKPSQTNIMQLMELLVSAPELPINDIDNKGNPIYNLDNPYDKKRIQIIYEIEKGVLNFVKDICNSFISKDISLIPELSMELNISLLENFVKNLSAIDTFELQQIYHSHDVENKDFTSLFDALISKI